MLIYKYLIYTIKQKPILINFLIFIIVQVFCLPGFSQINSDGIPFIKNYSPRTYNADEFNWSIAKDHRGVMYFGNNEYILEYDGQNWSRIAMPGQDYVVSLAAGHDGTIYAGGVNDFGHLVIDSLGQLEYKSLAGLIDGDVDITRVWKIYSQDQLIYFCTLQYIFIYNTEKNTIDHIKLEDDNFFSFLIEDKLYTNNLDLGLLELKGNIFEKVKEGDYFIDKDIFTILPWSDDTLLIYTAQNGLCLYDKITGNVAGFDFTDDAINTNNVLMENNLYAGVKIDDSLFAFGTQINGIFIVNKEGSIVTHLNEEFGLQNEIVTNLFWPGDDSGVLWLTLANGITSVNISSPVYGSKTIMNETINDICKHNGNYYVATLQGVYRKEYSASGHAVFKHVEGLAGDRSYAIHNIITQDGKENLIAAGSRNIYEIKNNQSHLLKSDIEAFRILQSGVFPNRVYVATNRGLHLIKIRNNQLIFNDNNILALDDESITKITEDKDGKLWCETLTGSYIVNPDGTIRDMPEKIVDKSGTFFNLADHLYFIATNENNVYKYNYSEHDFNIHPSLNNLYFEKGKHLRNIFPFRDTLALACYEQDNDTRNDILTINNDTWTADTLSLRIIPPVSINDVFADNQFVLIGSADGLFIYNEERKKDFKKPFKTLIRTITMGADSLVFKGGDGFFERMEDNKESIEIFHSPIQFAFNNITFTYSSPYYEKVDELVYSSYLEGFDLDWSPWSPEVSRPYNYLREGTYRFYVKAKNIYGKESQPAIFEFTVLPPWYRTWWAYIIYIIIGIAVIAISISLYTRKLQQDKKRLEEIVRERTAEIMEKNKEIEQKNISITDSIRYAKRIQSAVLPDKQTSNMFEYFIYFKPKDIVSGDFYWLHHFRENQKIIVAAADCTGHGVPGAFMSMLGTAFMNEIVAKSEVQHSDQILNVLRDYVIDALQQGVKENERDKQKDGMDIGLVVIDLEKRKLEFSGANNSMLFFRNGELIEYKPDRMPIGTYRKQDTPFTRTDIQIQNNDIFYLFSDGYADQFGGEEGSKYMKKRFKEFISSIHNKSLDEQKTHLEEEMNEWSKSYEQIDDQLIIGMRAIF